MALVNQKIVLINRPVGVPKQSDFKLVETVVPELKEGEVLLKTLYFTLDPYMRGRMNTTKGSYVPSFHLNEALDGGAICVVQDSKNSNLQTGDLVLTASGWQKYVISKGKLCSQGMPEDLDSVKKLPNNVKPSYFLGALGMPGFTGHYGLLTIGQPKAGETVVVAAATGPVGSMVGQIAKLKGCRVVGIAGGEAKCRYAVTDLGFDECVDHHSKTFAKDLAKSCTKGIDIYYENVGGAVFYTVLPLLNQFARVPLCGAIAWYNSVATLQEPGFKFSNLWSKLRAFIKVFLKIDRSPLIITWASPNA